MHQHHHYNKWTLWFKLMYLSVIVIGFGLFCLLCGYWMAFVKYARIGSLVHNDHGGGRGWIALKIPYEIYFIISGALFAIVGGFIYTRATKTIDHSNECLSNYLIQQQNGNPNNHNHQNLQNKHSAHHYKPNNGIIFHEFGDQSSGSTNISII